MASLETPTFMILNTFHKSRYLWAFKVGQVQILRELNTVKKQEFYHVESSSSDGAFSLLTPHVLDKCALLIALSLMMERTEAPTPDIRHRVIGNELSDRDKAETQPGQLLGDSGITVYYFLMYI